MSTPTAPQQQDSRREELATLILLATRALGTAWQDLAAAQTTLLKTLSTRRARRRRTGSIPPDVRKALREFTTATARFDRAAAALITRWAAVDLPRAYRAGAEDALRTAVLRAGQARTTFTWTAEHQNTITALSAAYYATLMHRIQDAVRRAQAFQRAVTAAARQPGTPDTTALAAQHDLGTVRYAGDRRHPVEAWAHSALAAQAGTTASIAAVRAALDMGAQWMQITDGPECGWVSHPDPDHADGTLRSVEEAGAYPIAHPGCIRRMTPRPDLTGRTDIEEGQAA